MKQIELLSNPNNKRQAAFLAICTSHTVWENYDGISKKDQQTIVPQVLLVNRWDGRIGFPGGFVEEGESLKDAAIRETIEEIGYIVNPDNVVPICSHETPTSVAHLFRIDVSFNEAKSALYNLPMWSGFGAEIVGGFLAHIMNYGKNKGIENLLQSGLAPSVKEQLELLYKTLGGLTHV